MSDDSRLSSTAGRATDEDRMAAGERAVIAVDVETSGLDPERHVAVEVAWKNLDTGEEGVFIPPHDPGEILAHADIEALRVNRYIDRIPGLPQDSSGRAASRLAGQLNGNTLAGANPAFDASFLGKMFGSYSARHIVMPVPRWHHRLVDVSAYTAGMLGIAPGSLPGLDRVCWLLGVNNGGPHTAMGDVQATAECFARLDAIRERRGSGPRYIPDGQVRGAGQAGRPVDAAGCQA